MNVIGTPRVAARRPPSKAKDASVREGRGGGDMVKPTQFHPSPPLACLPLRTPRRGNGSGMHAGERPRRAERRKQKLRVLGGSRSDVLGL